MFIDVEARIDCRHSQLRFSRLKEPLRGSAAAPGRLGAL